MHREGFPLLIALSLLSSAVPAIEDAEQWVSSGNSKNALIGLYTSEGCSSCPPADDFLSELGKRDDSRIIPLAFHVDYWDYIGWKDPFAQAQFTDRQRTLAAANHQRAIYTPQFAINGKEARWRRFDTSLESAQRTPPTVTLSARAQIDDETLHVAVKASDIKPAAEHAVLRVAITENRLSNAINAGENHGRTLHHDHVVRLLTPAKPLKPEQQLSLALDSDWKREDLDVVVWAEDPLHLDIHQAMTLKPIVAD